MKIRILLFAALVISFSVFPVRAQLHSNSEIVAIKAGKLLDPETGKTTANQIILVEENKIKEIGGNVSIPAEAKVIDLSKATVLPGLFDAHTHLCMAVIPGRDQGNYYFTTLLDTTGYRAIEGVANGMAMLQSGFTTVRDIGNAGNYADTDLRHAIEAGWVQGPPELSSRRTAGNSICNRRKRTLRRRNISLRTRATRCAKPSARTFISERGSSKSWWTIKPISIRRRISVS